MKMIKQELTCDDCGKKFVALVPNDPYWDGGAPAFCENCPGPEYGAFGSDKGD
ncbi:hypothetical protein NST50_05190 [Paenibacillus sp. FSL E2-0202]|uniref:hypothetical protein n=1 Tax=Paenibacillus sp. FSL E2-0202 TaxID=2954505 RepID=UPI0030ED9DA4